jgi:predicted DNA-binding transcriptional regulator AlpA
MLDILEISKHLPDLNVTVKASDLLNMMHSCIQEAREELKQLVTDANTETYISREKAAEIFGVCKVTIWRWRKGDYLVPIKIGRKVRYKMSDIKRLLGERGCNM